MIYIIFYCLQIPPIFFSMYCLQMMQDIHNSRFQICFDETESLTYSLIARSVEIQSCSKSFLQHAHLPSRFLKPNY